ncbi:hypothetical protein ACFORG_01670 [Lutimaribacter marinistellae]|uniref:Uncharacterized protein n=1 Tax=Lutimaribacter marinistellae TaxID=1820329 RepID=A0ABV7TC59_9RHOB
MKNVLIVGHSHIGNLQQAFSERAGKVDGLNIEFAPVGSPSYQPNLDAAGELHPTIAQIVREPRFDMIVSCLAGNAHFSLGLVNNPRKYDFVLPQAPDLPLEEGAEILPYGLIRKHLLEMAHETIPVLPAIRAATATPMLHLESPPPVPPGHVRQHAKHFLPLIHHYGLPRPERILRFWHLQAQITKDVCAENGIGCLPIPDSMKDKYGFLVQAAWRDDPTHAGPAYGHAVLDQLAEHLNEVVS